MSEIYEEDYETCEYCHRIYEERDTGYREYGCYLTDDICTGGTLDSKCPLSFRYSIEDNKEND